MFRFRSSAAVSLAYFALTGVMTGCDVPPNGAGGSPLTMGGCLTCHSKNKGPLYAPPFALISERYSGNANAASILAESLRSGTHGKWTEYPGAKMPPQSQLSEEEAKALVQWILNQSSGTGTAK